MGFVSPSLPYFLPSGLRQRRTALPSPKMLFISIAEKALGIDLNLGLFLNFGLRVLALYRHAECLEQLPRYFAAGPNLLLRDRKYPSRQPDGT